VHCGMSEGVGGEQLQGMPNTSRHKMTGKGNLGYFGRYSSLNGVYYPRIALIYR
jgi:hypothetical protein